TSSGERSRPSSPRPRRPATSRRVIPSTGASCSPPSWPSSIAAAPTSTVSSTSIGSGLRHWAVVSASSGRTAISSAAPSGSAPPVNSKSRTTTATWSRSTSATSSTSAIFSRSPSQAPAPAATVGKATVAAARNDRSGVRNVRDQLREQRAELVARRTRRGRQRAPVHPADRLHLPCRRREERLVGVAQRCRAEHDLLGGHAVFGAQLEHQRAGDTEQAAGVGGRRRPHPAPGHKKGRPPPPPPPPPPLGGSGPPR